MYEKQWKVLKEMYAHKWMIDMEEEYIVFFHWTTANTKPYLYISLFLLYFNTLHLYLHTISTR